MIRFNAEHRDCFKTFADSDILVVVPLRLPSFKMKLILILPPTQMISACTVWSWSFVRTLMISEIASGWSSQQNEALNMILLVVESDSGWTLTSSASVGRSWKIGDSVSFCFSSFTCSITVANRAALSNWGKSENIKNRFTQIRFYPESSQIKNPVYSNWNSLLNPKTLSRFWITTNQEIWDFWDK